MWRSTDFFGNAELAGDGALAQAFEAIEQKGLAAWLWQALQGGPDMPQVLAGLDVTRGVGAVVGNVFGGLWRVNMQAFSHLAVVVGIGGQIGAGAVEPGPGIVRCLGGADLDQADESCPEPDPRHPPRPGARAGNQRAPQHGG